MNQKLKNILLNNWTLSLVIFVPLILIINPVKNKYQTSITGHEILTMPGQIYFSDLNLDGNSDRIEFYENKSGFGSVKIFDPNHRGQAKANKKKHTQKSTGKGLLLMSEYISLLNKQNKQKITTTIIDLKGNQSGTLVRISIPVHFNFNLK